MSITQNGSTLVWDGTVTITNATDITSGVATLQLTPAGGIGVLPALAQGLPGQPPVLTMGTVTTLSAGSNATATLTQTSAGGSGTSSAYTLALGIPTGATGSSGSFTLHSATDLSSSPAPAVGNMIIVQTVSGGVATAFQYAPQATGDTYNTTTFTAASGNSPNQVLGSITIAAQGFNWRPRCSGFATPTGTANTKVDLLVQMGSSTFGAGNQVAYGPGYLGAGSTGIPAFPVHLDQAFGASIGTGSYGVVNAGSAQTFYFMTNQTNTGTTDSYSVPATSCSFTLQVCPIPNTN